MCVLKETPLKRLCILANAFQQYIPSELSTPLSTELLLVIPCNLTDLQKNLTLHLLNLGKSNASPCPSQRLRTALPV